MKLKEISRVKEIDQHSDLAKRPVIDNLEKITWHFQGYELFGTELPHSEFYLELRDKYVIVGWYVYRLIQLHGSEYANTQRIVIEPAYRGKGLGTIFHYYVTRYLKLKVLSDEYISRDGERLLKSLITKFKTSVIDISSGEIRPFVDGDLNKIITNRKEPTDFRLIYENNYIMEPHSLNTCPEYTHISEGF